MRTALAMLFTLLPLTGSAAPPSDGEVGFAARLYGELAHDAGNLFFSPTSIRLCMGLAYAGARGPTAEQMRATLGLPAGQAGHDAVEAQLKRWDGLANPELPKGTNATDPSMQQYWEEELRRRTTKLQVANRLWTQKGHPFRTDYLTLLKKAYRAEPASVDFAKAPEAIRVEINRWISDKTEKKIPELLKPRMITSDTRSVLVNAVYFKATWDNVFDPRNTKPDSFFVTPARAVKAPLMRNTEHFKTARVDGAQLLEMPYADGKLSMVLVLPNAKDGLPAIEKKIVEGVLPGWLKQLKGERVDVTLPKLKISGRFSLGEILKRMGMALAFTFPGADFSGIDDTKLLYLSEVVHEAVVTVDEKGTEAAAATAASMRAGGMPQQPSVFRADHPFVFFVRDMETGAVLFMGRLADPTAS